MVCVVELVIAMVGGQQNVESHDWTDLFSRQVIATKVRPYPTSTSNMPLEVGYFLNSR